MHNVVMAGVGVLTPGAVWFDADHAHRWISQFVMVAGVVVVLFGLTWFAPARPGPHHPLALRFRYRAPGGLALFAVALALLAIGYHASSALAACVGLALLLYRPPWPHRRTGHGPPSAP